MYNKKTIKAYYTEGYNHYQQANGEKNKICDTFFLNKVQAEAFRQQAEHPLKDFNKVLRAVYTIHQRATDNTTRADWRKTFAYSFYLYQKRPCLITRLLLTGMYLSLYQANKKVSK